MSKNRMKRGDSEEMKPLKDSRDVFNNILTKQVKMSLNPRQHGLNLNTLVIGNAGTGKTRSFVLPNIMQMNASYVIHDCGGEILQKAGKMLTEAGYTLKVLNLVDITKSMRYNPFAYIRNEKDIAKFADVIIANTKGNFGEHSAEKLYLTALVGYILSEAHESEKNIYMLAYMSKYSDYLEDYEEFTDAVDLLFKDLEVKAPENFAVKQYKKFKLAAGNRKTVNEIICSCKSRLSVFDSAELQKSTDVDEMELDTIGDKKTALFVISSGFDNRADFLMAMIFEQAVDTLFHRAKISPLPVHVRFIMDDFVNMIIPGLDKDIASIRSSDGISFSLIIQEIEQLKANYGQTWALIAGNCDSMLFLGGKDKNTLTFVSEEIGNVSVDELAFMPSADCVLKVRGHNPFFCEKYRIENHQNYRLTGDFDEKNALDINQKFNNGRIII